jgi:Family of unknown function (DUF6384)
MTASAAAAVSTAAAKPQTLDELMLAMDVVDTIRHRELLVERELGQGARDEALRNRLRDIYKSQGIEVTDRVIDEGIKALKESRFVYTPPPPSLGRTLALVWVARKRIAGLTSAILIGITVLWGGYQFGVVAPAERTAEQTRIELAETLPKALASAHAAAIAEIRTDMTGIDEFEWYRASTARGQAETYRRDGRTALARNDAAAARTALASLEALRAQLVQTYELRIVMGESGVWRIPDANNNARNYYLIVEAVAPDGQILTMPIKNEEDGRTYNVSAWGVRVPESTFDAVRRDKEDDGIIQDRTLGQKTRGELAPRYRMPVSGGAITSW